ncbi:MAG: hypothetical protein AAGJ18_15490 [Bacteroidota bacterium]
MRTIRFLAILSHLLIVGTLAAQPTNNLVQDVVLQPPNAASLGKYGDVPINYSVGLPNISVPLETVADGPIGVPISLSYHPSGIRVSEMASWVGLGWSLNAGGMISRTVLGIPDLSVNGYFNSGGDVSTDPNDVCNIGTGNLDGEPDVFNFNFPGYSGKFFFGSNQEIYVISEETDLKIGYEFSGNTDFAAFTITTPDGTRYFFGKDPYTQVTAYEQMQAGNNATNWRNSWMLLRIESFDAKNTIQLSYTPETYNYKSPASCRYVNAAGPHETTGVSCPGSNGDNLILGFKYNHIIQYVTTQRLTQISSPTKTVNFIGYVAREDLVGTSFRLEAIQCQSGTFCKRFNFSYDYFFDYLNHTNDNNHPWFKRLKLQQVGEISCDGTESKNAHVFEYAGPSQNGVSYLPHRLTKAVDNWGFYNGKHNNDNLEVNVPSTTILHPNTGVPQTYGSALRDSDENFMDYGVLNKITYPTGGHTAFTFEGNTARIISLTEDK